MNCIRTFTLITAAILLVIPAAAQSEEDLLAHQRHPQALGFQLGEISGTGLSYQRWFDPWGIQVAAGGYYNPIIDEDDTNSYRWPEQVLQYSIGLELQRSVFAAESERHAAFGQLYLVSGITHQGYMDMLTEDGKKVNGPYIPVFGVGAGIGIEIILIDHLSIPLELLYAGSWSGIDAEFSKQLSLDLRPQIGFRYRY